MKVISEVTLNGKRDTVKQNLENMGAAWEERRTHHPRANAIIGDDKVWIFWRTVQVGLQCLKCLCFYNPVAKAQPDTITRREKNA